MLLSLLWLQAWPKMTSTKAVFQINRMILAFDLLIKLMTIHLLFININHNQQITSLGTMLREETLQMKTLSLDYFIAFPGFK